MSHVEFNFYPWNCAPDLTNSNLNASTTTEKCFTDLELIVQQRSNRIARTGIKENDFWFSKQPAQSELNPAGKRFAVQQVLNPLFLWSFVQDGFWHAASRVYFSFRGVSGLSLTEEHCCTWCCSDLSWLRSDFSLAGGRGWALILSNTHPSGVTAFLWSWAATLHM